MGYKKAVIGCGFGDEGKGKVVSFLCSNLENPIIIRFSGGHQAGHHVVINDRLDHVFSNFGSGTLQGFDTYWSKFCTVDPVGILNELDDLNKKGVKPKLYIDKNSPITTPYEKKINKVFDTINQHGSVGVGIGATYQREENFHSIVMSDLYYPSILKIKLDLLEKYYKFKHENIMEFIDNCNEVIESPEIILSDETFIKRNYENYIFEGSQGLLLDQHFGFFPHVTRSNTGSKNILEFGCKPQIILVTRAYQTRHGNGPMTNENIPNTIKNNPYERNFDYGMQGKFRKTILDLDLLKYAVNKDDYIRENKFSLVITCMDLITEYTLTLFGKVYRFEREEDFIEKIRSELRIVNIFISRTPYPTIEEF